jgi:hypothetical protein
MQAQVLALACANAVVGTLVSYAALRVAGVQASAPTKAAPIIWLLLPALPFCLPALVSYFIHPPAVCGGQARLLGCAAAVGTAAGAAALQLSGRVQLLAAGLLYGGSSCRCLPTDGQKKIRLGLTPGQDGQVG